MKLNKKIEILDKIPQISKEEVSSYMNFNSVLTEYEGLKGGHISGGKTGSNILKISLISVGVIVGGLLTYHFIAASDDGLSTPEISSERVNADPVDQPQPLIDISQPIEFEDQTRVELGEVKDIREVSPSPSITKAKESVIPENSTEEATYSYVEAVPVEGLTYLYAYFQENLTYPDELRKDSIEGVVLVSFLIAKDSSVSNIQIVQSLGEQFDKEAIRVVSGMPKWIPATVNSTPVNSKLSIPLTFNIKK